MANETTLNMTLLLRRAEFNDTCVLKEGEPGFNTKTHEFKIGQKDSNGNLIQWKDLPLANETQIKSWIETVRSDLQGKLDKLDDTYVTDTEFTAYQQAMAALLGTFPIGDGENQYADIKAYIDAMDAADQAYARAQDNELEARVNAKIGTSADTKDKTTVYGAIAAEAYAREQADIAITNKIGNIGTDTTVAARLQAADTTAANAASAASAAGQAIDNHKADTNNPHGVTATQLGLGNVENKSTTTIKTEFTGAIAEDNAGFVTGGAVYAADKALGDRLGTVEAKLTNVSNVMDFVGAAEALPEEGSNQNGDVIVITAGDNAGKEFVYDNSREAGKKWVEFGSTSASDAAIATLQSRMTAAEEDIGENTSAITTLGTNKLDKSVYEDYIDGKAMSDVELQAAAAKKAGELDTALHAVISKEIDDDVKAAIEAEVTRSNTYADKAEEDAIATAASQADAKDATLHTTITGEITTAKSEAISAAAGDATSKANAAEANAKSYADAKKTEAIAAAATDATSKANTAKSEAIAAVVGTADSDADSDTIKGVKKAYVAADTTVLNSAKAYADTAAANAVKNNIKAGNTDIVITRPTSGEDKDKTVISHKVYGSGTYTKPDSVNDANFVTGVTIENGHVTGASVKSLAEALKAMTFIFNGGTSADTIE